MKMKKTYSSEALDDAVKAVKTNSMSKRRAAAHFKVPRSTLIDKLSGRYSMTPQPRTILTAEEELKVATWLKATSARGCGKNKEELFLAIQKILNSEGRKTVFPDNKPGRSWYHGFLKRHPEVKERKTMVLGEQRAQVTEGKIRSWFREVEANLFKDGIDIKNVPPKNIFNCDETGFPFFIQGSTVLTDVENKHPYEVGTDNKRQITVLGCGSAGGQILPSTIIFPGVRWTWHPWEDFKDAHFALTSNGWINHEVFLQWLQETFLPAVRHLERPVILFADGHTSHVNMEVHDICVKNRITYYVLPPHASHIIQPLDLVFYGSLKEEWKKAVRDFKAIARIPSITKFNFTRVFRDALTRAFIPSKLTNAFAASGLSPWNPDRPDYTKCTASLVFGKCAPRRQNTTLCSTR